MTLDPRAETARGYMLIGILYIHALIAFASTRADPQAAIASFVQIKLLAPHVSVFFFLSGMGARGLGRRSFGSVATQSLMLVLLAAISHAIGYLIGPLLHEPPPSWGSGIRDFARPLVYGTGYCTFVAWFFIVLAIARLLAWLFERGWLWFAGGAIIVAALVLGSRSLGLPDNVFEWRNIPAATVFFLIGMRIGRERRIPGVLGPIALFATIALAWFNRPGLLATGPCLDCDLTFVSQPMVGQNGSLPIFFLQELSFLIFLLWGGQTALKLGIARVPRYFGRYSVHLLLLNGWVMVALFPLALPLLPQQESVWLLLMLFTVNLLLHVALLHLLRPIIDRVLMGCFAAARWLVALPSRILRMDAFARG